MSDDLKCEIAALLHARIGAENGATYPLGTTCSDCLKEVEEDFLPLFDRVIVASFEQAVWAIEEAHRRNTSWENAMSRFRNFILAQIPAKVRLRAEIRELERVEAEAKKWDAYHYAGEIDGDLYWNQHRLAAISQELAEKRESYEKVKGGDAT